MKAEQDLSVILDKIFVITEVDKNSLMCLPIGDKMCFIVFSSKELAQKYLDSVRSLKPAEIIEIPDRVRFITELKKEGKVVIDPIWKDNNGLRSFYEIKEIAAISMNQSIGQA